MPARNALAHGADSTPAGAWCYLAPVAFEPLEGRTMTTGTEKAVIRRCETEDREDSVEHP